MRGQKMNAQRLRAISDYFEGLTDRIALARSALAKNDREGRAEAVTKAQKILFGLRDSLDHEKGGELANNLDSLYEYSNRRLIKAHVREDDSIFEEVMDLMVMIREAWKQIPTNHEIGKVQ
jgi:flagellar protein FliS